MEKATVTIPLSEFNKLIEENKELKKSEISQRLEILQEKNNTLRMLNNELVYKNSVLWMKFELERQKTWIDKLFK